MRLIYLGGHYAIKVSLNLKAILVYLKSYGKTATFMLILNLIKMFA